MAKTMTAAAVKNYRPGDGRREIPDGGCPGLYLVIQTSGHRSWAMRFRRPNGKPAKLTLGPIDLSGQEAESEPVVELAAYACFGEKACCRDPPPACHGPRCGGRLRRLQAPPEV